MSDLYYQNSNGVHDDIEEIHINNKIDKRFMESPQKIIKQAFEHGNAFSKDADSSTLRPLVFHEDLMGSIQIYSLWMRTFSKDKSTAELRWQQFRKSARDRYDAFDRRLRKIESDININEGSDICLDINYIQQKKENIDAILTQIEKYDTEFAEVGKLFEQFCQFLPKEIYRNKVDTMMRTLRGRYFNILQELNKRKEILRWVIPRYQRYRSAASLIKAWLDLAEPRCEPFVTNLNDNSPILENKRIIEEIAEEIYIKKTIYEDMLAAGKGILGIDHEMKMGQLQEDIEEVSRRWDYICANIEKCLGRIIKEEKIKLAEMEKKTDTEKIDIKLKDESQLCTCFTNFKILKVGDGKYTFGTTKTIRLLRIHGNSIVVRVGGGWEYLYNFLLKVDPCRAKHLAAQPEKAAETIKNLTGISLIPADKQNSSFTMSVQRLHKSSYAPVRNMNRTFNSKRTVSVDQLDSCGESFNSLSMSESSSTSSIPHTTQPKGKFRFSSASRNNTEKSNSFSCGAHIHDVKLNKSSENINKRRPTERVSLMERQSQYARRRCAGSTSALNM